MIESVPRLAEDEKKDLLQKYHPDYIESSMRPLKVGVNKGDYAPVELAEWYARFYQGEVLDPEHTALLLSWLEEGIDESVFLNNLPDGADVRSYVKGGTRQSDDLYHVNFFHEAGIVETEHGAFALALFMQGNPEWPGTWSMSEVARIAYEHFVAAHTGAPPPEG